MESQDTKKQLQQWLGSGSINIFGRQYAGKDTHGEELARYFNTKLIGGGDILRSSDNEEVKAHIAQGHLAPQEQYLAMVLPFLSQSELHGKPLILSSVGRWRGEEQYIIDATNKSEHQMKAVLFLDITQDEVYRRWKFSNRERHDESEESLNKRLDEFAKNTLPVIDYYRQLGLVIDVDAMPPIADVTETIISKLLDFSKQGTL